MGHQKATLLYLLKKAQPVPQQLWYQALNVMGQKASLGPTWVSKWSSQARLSLLISYLSQRTGQRSSFLGNTFNCQLHKPSPNIHMTHFQSPSHPGKSSLYLTSVTSISSMSREVCFLWMVSRELSRSALLSSKPHIQTKPVSHSLGQGLVISSE